MNSNKNHLLQQTVAFLLSLTFTFSLPAQPRVSLYRVLKRFFLYRGRTRLDMADGCNEKIDIEFISWIWNYQKRNRPRILEEMEHFVEKRLVILRSKREIDLFLQGL